ncbi:MAG: cell wall-binding repeat-containing protein, partial [Tissierellia bacterium]|nr:cell wall-binding repeat-containing protein [Tissierellia bacterium]
ALTDDVKAYLEKGTKEVTILGGSASVKEEVAKELKDAKYTVERIAGKDRYKTAVEVANKMETVENILVASGENYADALVASAAANKLGNSAVLLTEKSKLNDDAKEYMTTNKETAKKAFVFGGENSVSDEAMEAVKEIVEVERVKGEDRDETAVAAAKEFFKESTSAVVASGANYADALVAGTMDEPVLLVTKNVNDTVKTYLKDQIEDAKVIGGTNSVSDAILKDIAANLK